MEDVKQISPQLTDG